MTSANPKRLSEKGIFRNIPSHGDNDSSNTEKAIIYWETFSETVKRGYRSSEISIFWMEPSLESFIAMLVQKPSTYVVSMVYLHPHVGRDRGRGMMSFPFPQNA